MFLALVLAPRLKRHFPSIGVGLYQEGCTPTPPCRRASLHRRRAPSLHPTLPQFPPTLLLCGDEQMASLRVDYQKPSSTSIFTGALRALFSRRRPRLPEPLYRSSGDTRMGGDEDWGSSSSESNDHDEIEEDDGDNDNDNDNENASLQRATAAWNRMFNGQSQLELAREEILPFTIGQRLGGGGVGVVHETHIYGVPVALKRTYTHRITPQQLNEIKILGRMSKDRHHHVVELVGSYVHKQKKTGYEIGILIWPVAHTDLAALLRDYNALWQYYLDHLVTDHGEIPQPASPVVKKICAAMEPLFVFVNTNEYRRGLTLRQQVRQLLFEVCGYRIRHSLGCIANAVAYLHENRIRHKDLKPSQILLSPQGLWLADFGWSADMSEHSTSITSGGDQITAKYQAPERANQEPCGRSEDIFSLGCIFLEMAYCVASPPRSDPRPWLQKGWSFQANLDQVQDWMKPLGRPGTFMNSESRRSDIAKHIARLPRLLEAMLAPARNDRPPIKYVVHMLHARFVNNGRILFAGGCCESLLRIEDYSEESESEASNPTNQKGDSQSFKAELELPPLPNHWPPQYIPDSQFTASERR